MRGEATTAKRWARAKALALCVLAFCLVASFLFPTPIQQAFAKGSADNVPFVGNMLKIKKGNPEAVALGAFGKPGTKYGVILGSTKSYKGDDEADNYRDVDEDAPVVPTIPASVLPNPTTEEFIALIGEQAREIAQENGLYASVMIAQAILESGSGGSGLSKPPYNNLFGIKGSYKGSAVYMLTSEDDGSGNYYDIVAAFRSYPSTRESLQDYADLLTKSMGDFYSPAWKANAKTYKDACDYLQGHYATSTSYSSSLQGLIIAYDLEQFDHPSDAAGFEAAAEDHAKGMFAAVSIGGASKVETDYEDVEGKAEGGDATSADAGQGSASTVAVAAGSGDDAREAIAAFAKSPVGQAAAFCACPLAVGLVLVVRGGVGALALPVGFASQAAALSKRIALRIALLLGR